jgi:hypothetical protein
MQLVIGERVGLMAENPFMAAQTFLVKNELPASYLDQVVDFIHKNTNGETLGQDTSNTYVDPYTGSSRYTGSTAQSTNQGGSDPFTGMSPFLSFLFCSSMILSDRELTSRWISI